MPDCRTHDEGMMITGRFYLKSTPEGSQFWPIRTVGTAKDYLILSIEDVERPARLEADGILKIGILPDDTPKPWAKTWDKLNLDRKREYMGCAEIPAIIPDPLVRIMVHVDDIDKACHAGMTAVCKKLLFKIADDNHDKKISLKEMKMAGAMLTGFASLIEKHTVKRDDLDKTLYQSLQETDRIAGDMPEGGIGYDAFVDLVVTSDSDMMRKALVSVGSLIPGFIPNNNLQYQ